jgi:hypothetical protein
MIQAVCNDPMICSRADQLSPCSFLALLCKLPFSFFGVNEKVSSPGESHPEALAELYVSLSTHTAPIKEPCRVLPSANGQTALAHAAKGA